MVCGVELVRQVGARRCVADDPEDVAYLGTNGLDGRRSAEGSSVLGTPRWSQRTTVTGGPVVVGQWQRSSRWHPTVACRHANCTRVTSR